MFLGGPVLLYGGLATIVVGVIGLMSSIHINRLASFSVIVSSGTLLSALALGVPIVTSAALFYLLSATVAVSALFLLEDLVERLGTHRRDSRGDVESPPDEDTNLDDEEEPLVGRAIPVSVALLGLAFFASTVLIAGLPPLSGFIAKVALLSAVLSDTNAISVGSIPAGWWILGLVLLAGLVTTISLSRSGIRHFWATSTRSWFRISFDTPATISGVRPGARAASAALSVS